MYSKVESIGVYGLKVSGVTVEVDISNGMPMIDMIGLLSSEVKEAKERVRTALRQAGITYPPQRMTILLAPASVRKSGGGFDLAIATSVLLALGYGMSMGPYIKNGIFYGELGLDGSLRSVKGALAAAMYAKEKGKKYLFLPYMNREEAIIKDGPYVIGLRSVRDLMLFMESEENREIGLQVEAEVPCFTGEYPDFSDLRGQRAMKRAAEIAAAGRHHLVLIGAPGCGKSMIAERMPGILPPLNEEEMLEVTRIYSIAGKLSGDSRVRMRPFRSPHHTCTRSAMSGGGKIPYPGEITLAHRGILFLDEFPEFSRETLESLRQPLEQKKILILRDGESFEFPADFQLVAALNPCPCGYYPDTNRCKCTFHERSKYMGKLKGPLLDRMDLCVLVQRVSYDALVSNQKEESSEVILNRVMDARRRQELRYKNESFCDNGSISPGAMQRYVVLDDNAREFSHMLYEFYQLGARGYHKLLKTARTIADLSDSDSVERIHLEEAATYRLPGEVVS